MPVQTYPLHQHKVNQQIQTGTYLVKRSYSGLTVMAFTTKLLLPSLLRATFGHLLSTLAVARMPGSSTCVTATRTTTIRVLVALRVVSGGIDSQFGA